MILPPPSTLDEIVASFEAALKDNVRADLDDYLPPADDPIYKDALVELVRVELERDWESGTPQPIGHYFSRFPGPFAEAALRRAVAFEEYRLKRGLGRTPDPDAYAEEYDIETGDWPMSVHQPIGIARSYRAFRRENDHASVGLGSWMQSVKAAGPLAELFHDLHRSDPGAADRLADGITRLPSAGQTFLGFRLIDELGRGAFGRVFLAEQESLADRLVALKVTAEAAAEPQTLAQMQHTHIVPIYSLHRTGSLQAVCMPYFGSVTLADVLRDVANRREFPRSGSDLLDGLTVRRSRRTTTMPASGRGSPATGTTTTELPQVAQIPQAVQRKLEGFSYVEAVVWLGCCLAEGLSHAHDRGIVHRDLKPANILLTDEGQPMLLDFNLAEDVKLAGSASAAVVGGTIPYMAPEQLAAFLGSRSVVDRRADLFALGLILYEMLTGQCPFPPVSPKSAEVDAVVESVLQSRRLPPTPIRRWNRFVTPAVWSILSRCLDADPAKRYSSARELQEDLQRQLDHEPLKHAPEPSLRERFHKRLRRSPKLLWRWGAALAAACLVAAVLFGIAAHLHSREEEARADRLAELRQAQRDHAAAIGDIRQVIADLGIDEGPAREAEGVKQARRILDRLGMFDDDWRSRPTFALLDDNEREQLEDHLGDLLMIAARSVPPEEALSLLDRAEDVFGDRVPPSVWLQRAAAVERQGDNAEGRRLRDMALALPPRRARDHYLVARGLLRDRRYREALPVLEKAAALEPRNLTARLLLGLCRANLDHHADAVACFDVCLALAPEFHAGYFNRALSLTMMRKYDAAVADYDRAVALRPERPDGWLNRGLARLDWARPTRDRVLLDAAVADFNHVLELDPSQTRVLFQRSEARRLLGDDRAADADFQAALKAEPGDERSWNARGHAHLGRKEPAEALRCFDRGLDLHPRSFSNLTSKAFVVSEFFKRNDEALELCEKVVRWYPDYIYAHADRGILLARLGKFEKALDDARVALTRGNDAQLLYRVACIHALASATDRKQADAALQLLHDALRHGFGIQELPTDPDLKALHQLPEFARLRETALSLAAPPRR